MVRKATRAKRSSIPRRIGRFRSKYRWREVALRLKLYMPTMKEQLDNELRNLGDLEERVLAELEAKTVPQEIRSHYLAFTKRLLRIYKGFTGWKPLTSYYYEKQLLKNEFKLRGLDPNILNQVQTVIEDLGKEKAIFYGWVVPPPPVIWKSGFETGDLTEWDGYEYYKIPPEVITSPHHGTYNCKIEAEEPYDTYLFKALANYEILYFIGQIKFVRFSEADPAYVVLMTLGRWGYETCGIMAERDSAYYTDPVVRFTGYYWEAGEVMQWLPTYIELRYDRWYLFEIACRVHPTEGWFKCWIDKELAAQALNVNTTGSDFAEHCTGTMHYHAIPEIGSIIELDCFGLNDSRIERDPFI